MKRLLLASAALALWASPTLADKAAADKCAAGLGGDAKAIYAAAAPGFPAAQDPRALITEKTKALVQAGTVSAMAARGAAEAAGGCLMQMR
ncbi:hypothetical protein ACI7BZ_03685 [Xanthobacter sp. AM11]|uniref:hypothetical protein n=1 Tax=Xanthobacter sp. AM11 TaxID=3380643 RepID=UPI0039BF5B41